MQNNIKKKLLKKPFTKAEKILFSIVVLVGISFIDNYLATAITWFIIGLIVRTIPIVDNYINKLPLLIQKVVKK